MNRPTVAGEAEDIGRVLFGTCLNLFVSLLIMSAVWVLVRTAGFRSARRALTL